MGKTLGTRQKLNFRIEPSQRNVKPRSPLLPPSLQPNKNGTPHTNPKQAKTAETAPDQAPGKKLPNS